MIKSYLATHMLVKNESRWIWFALNSILPYADKVMVWDTGSTDNTVEIIKSLNSQKISFRQIKVETPEEHTRARQQMLEETKSEWVMIADGDEIWWWQNLKKTIEDIKNASDIDAAVSPVISAVGDVFHLQSAKDSRYQIHELRGAYNIRFFRRNILGLHVANPHGRQEYRDNNETPLQKFSRNRLLYCDYPYFHTTHLIRSENISMDKKTIKRDRKFRFQLGEKIPSDFVFPEVFYLPLPEFVPDPFYRRSPGYVLKSVIFEPLRRVKNMIYVQDGY